MTLLSRIAVITSVAGCIEGPEAKALHHIEPAACDTGLAANQQFVLSSNFEEQTLLDDPPRFVLEVGGAAVIELDTTVGPFGELTLTPRQPLPADSELTLKLVDEGALAGSFMPVWLPGRYSTRNAPAIRSYRAIEQRVYVSFTQRLAADTVTNAVTASHAGAPVRSEAMYLDAAGHVIWIELHDAGNPVDLSFWPALRTDRGDAVFPEVQTIQLDPAYTLPASDGCEDFG